MSSKKNIPWPKVFKQVALRAIRKVHIDYQLWGIGQTSDTDSNRRLSNLNFGRGIEFAPEPAVCDAITQEFINSTFTSGSSLFGERRSYRIDREISFNNERVDIVLNRFDPDKGYSNIPVLMEVKRAYYFTPRLDKTEYQEPKKQFRQILRDIVKLRNIREVIDAEIEKDKHYESGQLEYRFDNCFIWMFFWGFSDSSSHEEISKEINNELGDEYENKITASEIISISHMGYKENLWLCLHEIDSRNLESKMVRN